VPHVHARQGQRLGYRAKHGFVIYRTHLHEEVRPQTPRGQGPPLRQA
jgi:ribosomal protein L15E